MYHPESTPASSEPVSQDEERLIRVLQHSNGIAACSRSPNRIFDANPIFPPVMRKLIPYPESRNIVLTALILVEHDGWCVILVPAGIQVEGCVDLPHPGISREVSGECHFLSGETSNFMFATYDRSWKLNA